MRLGLLLATAAALLLVPAASAFADSPAEFVFSGNGSGSVNGSEEVTTEGDFTGGKPLVKCHWNGSAIDIGMDTEEATNPKPGVCKSTAKTLSPELPFTIMAAYANPDSGSAFAGWTVEEGIGIGGGCSEEESPLNPECTVVTFGEPEEKIKIKAAFNKAFTVEKVGGEGTVTGKESGMVCGPSKAYCGVEYTGPETLTASPAAGYVFSKWKGCTVAVGLKCEVTATSTTKVIAYFAPTKTFTVEKAGSATGKVTATGISCDESCSTATSAILAGKVVKVTTTPAKGSEAAVLEGGTGSASACGGSTCEFTISENSSVKVKFVPKPTKTLTLNLTGPGAYKGKVTGKSLLVKGLLKSAFSCGTGCTTATEAFFASDEIELIALAPTGYSFGGWTVSGGSAGNCTGTTTPCKLLSDANKTISAEFK